MDESYIVIEIQTADNGTASAIPFGYADRNEAESKYHQLLSAAAVSTVPVHAVSLLSNEGYLIESHSYAHQIALG